MVLVGLAAGLGGPVVLDARAAAQYPVTAADLAAGRAALDTLAIKGRAPRTGYERDEFGQPWADVDRNGCDTRNDILRRDLVDPVAKPGTRECVVLRGTLADPYTGESIAFERGERSSEVQIDHVVALADAWQKGAQRWTDEKRRLFANDPANLLAVDGSANQSKGAGDAATWLPPNTGYRCAYALRQTAVKAAYGLWVTQAEHDALTRAIDRCVVAG
ncbi:HNH endonuclease family protein [Cellulomonas sp. zg-B12]|nr:HNH endonuclease family protein [Cellulomonas xiejunii]